MLRPSYLQLIVDGVNEMAQYDHKTDKYMSPTLALNFGNLLKKCCDVAYIELLKQANMNSQQEDIEIFKKIIESQVLQKILKENP